MDSSLTEETAFGRRINAFVGRRLRVLRLKRGWTQTRLGQLLGISFQQVQKYEKGVNRVSAGALQIVALHLNLPVTDFFPSAEELEMLISTEDDPSAGEAFLRSLQGRSDPLNPLDQIADKPVRQAAARLIAAIAESDLAESDEVWP